MSALKTPEKTSRRQELRKNKIVELYAQALLFYEDRPNLVYGLGVGLLALVMAVPGYMYWQQQRQQQANELLGQVLPVYEQGQYQQALQGSGGEAGLLEIADTYGGTSAGNLATYYAGNAFYQTDQFDRALTYFERFEKEGNFIGASAYAAQASIHENRDNFERAAGLYKQAANQYSNALTTPRYLLEAGRAYEETGNFAAAEEAYQQIRADYPDSDQAGSAEQYLARVRARLEGASSS